MVRRLPEDRRHEANPMQSPPPALLSDFTDVPVSSELCLNQREARIVDVVWHEGAQRGCTIEPRQIISVNPWITFPRTRLNIPIKMNSSRVGEQLSEPIYVLVEAKFNEGEGGTSSGNNYSAGAMTPGGSSKEQFMGFTDYTNSLFVEEFGDPLAWRVDSHFSFLLRTDKERLLQFILASFMADNYAINNDLQLLRIECEYSG